MSGLLDKLQDMADTAVDFLDDGKLNDSTSVAKIVDNVKDEIEEIKDDLDKMQEERKKKGRVPEWVYEAIGTMFFTMMVCSSWGEDTSFIGKSMGVGMSFALCHVVFVSHCAAYFNPLMVASKLVTGDCDLIDAIRLIFGQYVGCAVGLGILGKVGGDTLADAAPSADGHQGFITLVIMAALLMKFFWNKNSDASSGLPDAIWYGFAIAVVHMIGEGSADSHMANPAVLTGNGVLSTLQGIFNPSVGFNLDFFTASLFQNVALYLGCLLSMLVTKHSDD